MPWQVRDSRLVAARYSGSIAGPAAIGFAAVRLQLRAAVLTPLALILCIVEGAGRIQPARDGELART